MSRYTLHNAIDEIGQQRWNHFCGLGNPFLRYEYFRALENSGCTSARTGWQPAHLTLQHKGDISGVIPLYLKNHSRGEYVFDWSWAQACESAGIAYYPKLVCAVPFTPATGSRWGLQDNADPAQIITALDQASHQQQVLSWHLLFCDPEQVSLLLDAPAAAGLLERHDCRFQWCNNGYADFDDFLARLTSAKRKSIRRERRKMQEQGIRLQRLTGDAISLEALDHFQRHYDRTYHIRGQHPYLNRRFFEQLHRTQSDQMLLVLAWQHGQCCGAALFMYDAHSLYGRWWGGDNGLDSLHFEACYYQGIEFAIERNLLRFDPGTQGEHKLIRGFEPILSRSLHRINSPQLAKALQPWVAQERQQVSLYMQQALRALPFRQINTG